jgi:hypothetical protein
MIKAIQTEYKDYRFRSRLEARWAIFFDLVGIRWEYEIEGFWLDGKTKYLPDFWLPQSSTLVEIKPSMIPNRQETGKCKAVSSKHQILLICGDPLEHKAMLYVDGDKHKSVSRLAMDDWLPVDFSRAMTEIQFLTKGKESSSIDHARYARKVRFEHGESPEPIKVVSEINDGLTAEQIRQRGDENLAALRAMLKR